MDKLQTSSNKLQSNTQTYSPKVKASLALSHRRTMGLAKIDTDEIGRYIASIEKDIISVFPELKEEHIIKALKQGSLGSFGRTIRFSSQEVILWVREYLKANDINEEQLFWVSSRGNPKVKMNQKKLDHYIKVDGSQLMDLKVLEIK